MLNEPAGIWQVRDQTERSKGVPRAEVCKGGGRGLPVLVEVVFVTVVAMVGGQPRKGSGGVPVVGGWRLAVGY